MATANIWTALKYESVKESAVLNIGSTAQQVAQLVTSALPAGTYFISYAFELDFNGTKDKPAYFQLTGTLPDANPFSGAALANGDHRNRLYGYPKVWGGGVMTIGMNMWKDAGISQLDCDFIDIMVERKA